MASQPFTIRIGRSNIHLIDTGEGLLVIDAGAPRNGAREIFCRHLNERGYIPSDVKTVLLTHAHADHLALARQLQDLGASVFIHSSEAKNLAGEIDHEVQYSLAVQFMLEHGVPSEAIELTVPRPVSRKGQETDGDERHTNTRRQRWSVPPLMPDYVLNGDDELSFGDVTIQTIHTPGHSQGSVVFLAGEETTLFSGDHVLQRHVPHVGISFIGSDSKERTRSLIDYLNSLDKLDDITSKRVHPGHGDAIADLGGAITQLKAYHQMRLKKVFASLDSRGKTAYELVSVLFPKLRPAHLWLGMSQIIGCLDVLEAQGAVSAQDRGGTVAYRLE
jgi:glyoxylase-like metal-dependent hydrolase (beta-lactamase superfamily II)